MNNKGKMSPTMRRAYLLLPVCIVLVSPAQPFAQTMDYPTKPVTMVVPFPAGGRTDVIGRVVAQHLSKQLGKPAAVVNKPGASSVLGSMEVAQSKPDGYTLGFFSTSAVTAQYTVPTPLSLGDFELVAIVNTDPAAIAVQESAPWKSLKQVVEDARKQPDQLRIGMIPGASAQIFAAGFARAANVKLINVPFKGDVDGAVALAGGHIEMHVAVPVSYKSLIDAKKVRILALAAEKSSPAYGNIPTFRDNSVDLVIGAFHGVYVPKGTPQPVVGKLAEALEKTVGGSEFIGTMHELGAGIEFLKDAEAKAFLAKQDSTYKAIIEDLGLRVAPAR
jgi:tripartite-type tricarboxylate transporter receptor subunit TctC